MSNIPGMNISYEPYGPLSDDYLYLIELSLPKKLDILQRLDADGPRPTREATVVVFHGRQNTIKEYVVGPLLNPTYHRDVTFERYQKEIPFTARPIGAGEHWFMDLFLKRALKLVSELLEESFGIKFSEYFAYYDSMPKGVKTGDRQSWISICRNMEGFYIHPVGFRAFHKSQKHKCYAVARAESALQWSVL